MRRRISGRGRMAAALVFAAGMASRVGAQDPAPRPAAETSDVLKKAEDFIKPLPLEPIPDNPPPHEGAMFAISHRIEAVDLVLIEVLEALPGRPISGERLVRPDGTVSLGFYGDVHVAGLTAAQAKAKIVLHLRQFLSDQTLGLVAYLERGGPYRNPHPPLGPLPELPPPELLGGNDLPSLPQAIVPEDPKKDGAEKSEPKKEKAEENPNPPPAAPPAQVPQPKNPSLKAVDFFPGLKIQEFRAPRTRGSRTGPCATSRRSHFEAAAIIPMLLPWIP